MAALGACTTITLRMYADRKEWPLEEIGVRLDHRKLESDEPKTAEISQTLELVGPLNAKQRERLLEIAHRCPVHRALEAGVVMPMSLEGGGDA
jgi:putative redox protein